MPYYSTPRGNMLYYEEKGQQGRTLLLVHDWGTNLRVFDSVVGALAASNRVISVDLSGHGRSEVSNKVHGVEVFADDIDSVLSGLDVWDPVIVGWSMGGLAALSYVRRPGQRASALALVGTSPYQLDISPYQTNWTPAFIKEIEGMAALPRPAFLRKYMELYFSAEVGSETVEWLAGLALESPAWVTAECSASQFKTDLRPSLPTISVPTLVMHGRLDRICTYDAGRYLAENIPAAQIATFELSGHTPHIEERDAFIAALGGFLA